MGAELQAVALSYFNRNWCSIDVPLGTKAPVRSGWEKQRLTEDEIRQRFGNGPVNIGVILGPASDNLTDVDLDCPEAIRAADLVLRPTSALFGRASKPKSHRLYRTSKPGEYRIFKDPSDKATLLELRTSDGTKGRQTIFPPSTHTSGEIIAWAGPEDASPTETPYDDLEQRCRKLATVALLGRHWPKEGRHDAALALTGALARAGLSERDIEDYLEAVATAADWHEDRINVVASTLAKVQSGESVTGWPTLAEKLGKKVVDCARHWLGLAGQHEITIGPDLHSCVDKAIDALVDREQGNVYQRCGMLVRITTEAQKKHGDKYQRAPDSSVISPMPQGRLAELMARSAKYVRVKNDGSTVPAEVPERHVRILAERGEWPFPILQGIAVAPFLRPDGTICTTPGHDEGTGLLYAPNAEYPEVPDAPTRDEARRAMNVLTDPFAEFPYVDPDMDSAAVLAGVLTLFAMPAIDCPSPMFVIRKSAPGEGGTLIADLASIIGTGTIAGKTTLTPDAAEMRKLLLSVAMEGAPLLLFDNAVGSIGSSVLSSALTSGIITDRILGSNRTIRAPWRCVPFVTGNGLTFKRDLGRRVILADLNSQSEHPEDRGGWKYPDVKTHVREHRGELVVAALTILRAHSVAGRPGHGEPLKGGFESWDNTVRAALVWAGAGDPCATAERVREDGDSDLAALRAALTAVSERFDEPQTAADIVRDAQGQFPECVSMRGALADLCGCPEAKLVGSTLGYALRQVQGRVAGGMHFEKDGEIRGTTLWAVRKQRTCHGDEDIEEIPGTPRERNIHGFHG